MKKLIPILLAVFAFAACEKEPDMGKLDNEYLVFTNFDKGADFKAFNTYYIPDSIMVISNKKDPEYLKSEGAMEIINTFVTNMNSRGYTRAMDKESAELGLQISYIQSTFYFNSYGDDSYWWNRYPGYWSPWYWGNWGNWYYPYSVVYSYQTGSILGEMVNLKAEKGATAKLPVIWNTYITGLLNYDGSLSVSRTVRAVNQAFKQSTYITRAN